MKASTIILLASIGIVLLVSSNINWTQDHWKYILEAYAKGYYAYLPATCIYGDLNFGFFELIEKEKYYSENIYYDYRASANGQTINKYYAGTALAQLPFFLGAHIITSITDGDRDGYSRWYMISVQVAAIFYLFLGLLFFNKTLRAYALSETSRCLAIVGLAFGTNLFYYTIGEPGMSHVFSFAFISLFIFQAKKFFMDGRPRRLLFLGATFGMILLIRPVNGLIILLLPLLAGERTALLSRLRTLLNIPPTVLISLLLCIAIISIQLIIYKMSTGDWWIYAYGEETFNFRAPHIWDMLFSYKKGLFLYTPLYLLSLTGFFFVPHDKIYIRATALGFFLVLTYILSSWWMWYYGGSFSSRVYVEYLPFFGIGLAVLLEHSGKQFRKIAIAILFGCIVLCQIQTYQYRYYEIHWSEMTKEKYWDVFLRIDRLVK